MTRSVQKPSIRGYLKRGNFQFWPHPPSFLPYFSPSKFLKSSKAVAIALRSAYPDSDGIKTFFLPQNPIKPDSSMLLLAVEIIEDRFGWYHCLRETRHKVYCLEERKLPRSLAMDMELDKISNLPGHIIDKILSLLSIRDAVRMSVLSSKWRFKWVTLPYLVFDNQCVSISSQDQTLVKNKLVNIIDHVLLLHTGPIHKFRLSHRDFLGGSDIDRWILYLSRTPIREFILEIWKGQQYKLPSCLYNCQSLIHLELFNSLLKPPPTFKGFMSLKSLDLQHIIMAQDAFENLISSCPLLEKFTLMNFDGFTHLNIHAPNLQFFDTGGVFYDVNFKNTFLLATVSIGLYVDITNDKNLADGNSRNLVKFFAHLPRIQRLEIQSYFLKYLAAGNVPGKLPAPCIDLTHLSIRINFSSVEENLTALCLLRSSPNLQELEMLARPEEQTLLETSTTLWKKEHWNYSFAHLQVVKLTGISGVGPQLDFINFLLAYSPVLEKMTVKPASGDGAWELIKDLLRFRRASVRAEIIYLDP